MTQVHTVCDTNTRSITHIHKVYEADTHTVNNTYMHKDKHVIYNQILLLKNNFC